MKTLTIASIKAIIIAGGASRRMGGGHKGSKTLLGKPMIEYVIERLQSQQLDIAINTNSDQSSFEKYGLPLFEDQLEGRLGPLAGLYSAFTLFDHEYILTVPCDTPLLPSNLLARMSAALINENADICTVSDGEHLHPVVLLAHRRVMKSLADYLKMGERKVQRWLIQQNHAIADFSDQADAFTNINTIEEFEHFIQRQDPS